MWMMHHLMHQNIGFTQLEQAKTIASQNGYSFMAVSIVILIVLAAMVKSAQVPFTSWLPRAMEGPTTSSAIFYGSLSVHIGVFLLLRTWPFWQDMLWAKVLIIVIGALTGIIATLVARVQPTVKTQIAYSSAAQIGIIFIEIALGWHVLALIHFAGNAFLRTYQLLVSPSVLNYLVHHQYFHYHPPQEKKFSGFTAALYVLGIKEWNLDTIMFKYLWSPFKWLGSRLQFLNSSVAALIITIIGITGLIVSIVRPQIEFDPSIVSAVLFAIALSVILFSFSYRGSALKAWWYLLLSHLFILAGIVLNITHINNLEIIFYASGIGIAFVLGLYCLSRTKAIDNDVVLNDYHGYVYEQKNMALLFLLAAIGMLGFPITAAFIGIDVLFTYIGDNQPVLIGLLALCMIFIELAAIRIFIRVFLGPHKKLNHPVAFRSS
jgi:NADH:ubiquinone oxidoreductase subunit 5 (subunit L)/multisubunit Na+/H+ antiporter MnhA subunit